MWTREDNITIINEIRNVERKGLDAYIDKRLIPLQKEYDFFIETLYKDIFYIINGIDEKGDNDLVLTENGDIAVEDDGEYKISGYQTRLHDVAVWLHQQVVQKMVEGFPDFLKNFKGPEDYDYFSESMQAFERNVLYKKDYTPEYKKKLDKIKQSIRDERQRNYVLPNLLKRLKDFSWDVTTYSSEMVVVVSLCFAVFCFLFYYITKSIKLTSIVIGFTIISIVFSFIYKVIDGRYYLRKLSKIRIPLSIILSLGVSYACFYYLKIDKNLLDYAAISGWTFVLFDKLIIPKNKDGNSK